jgi:hypothetical protein
VVPARRARPAAVAAARASGATFPGMAGVLELSAAEARRVALAAQGFAGSSEGGPVGLTALTVCGGDLARDLARELN